MDVICTSWVVTILWESTACAAYLMNHAQYPVPGDLVYVETTSYNTKSNAFFARTTMMDIHSQQRRQQQQHDVNDNDDTTTNEMKLTKKKSWRNILVVTK